MVSVSSTRPFALLEEDQLPDSPGGHSPGRPSSAPHILAATAPGQLSSPRGTRAALTVGSRSRARGMEHLEDREEQRQLGDRDVLDDELLEPLISRESTLEMGVSHLTVAKADNRLFESLDYEIVENDVFKDDWRVRKESEVVQYLITKWVFALLIGLITGGVAVFINFSVENISGAKLLVTAKYMNSGQPVVAFLIFAAMNLVLVLVGAVMTVYFAPSAAGSGVPEIKAYLNGIDAPGILGPNTLIVKMLGSICVVSAGLYLGKEGPLIHIGSCVAYFLGQGGSKRFHMDWNWLRVFRNDRDRRDLVTSGCAGGVAAAFRAPVGGVLFALEEITSWWRSALLWRTFFTTAVVALVLQIGKQICSGGCGLFGEAGLIMFEVSRTLSSFGFTELYSVVIIGIAGGILGSIFNKLNTKVTRIYVNFYLKKPRIVKVLHAGAMSLLTSACCFGLPWLAQCRPCPDLTDLPCPTHGRSGNFKGFNCPAGQYNDLAGLFFATKDDAVRNLFSTSTDREYHYSSICIFFVASFIFSLITYGITVPSGLFIPLILNGSSFGRLVGMFMSRATGDRIDEGLFAVLGAAAFLGGTMRMTVSLCVILLELTNNLMMLPMIMLALVISKTVGDVFNAAIWEMYVKLKGFPILEAKPEPFMHQLSAKDAVSTQVVSLSPVEEVRSVVAVLQNTTHNAFPIFEQSTTGSKFFAGLVLRSHILVLLKHKEFQKFMDEVQQERNKMSLLDFGKPTSGKGLKIEDIELSEEEESMFVDLRPVINSSPYTVLETTSLAKTYSQFRDLGLRHLCVLPRQPGGDPVIGVLTRHNFMQENLEKRFPLIRTVPNSKFRPKKMILV